MMPAFTDRMAIFSGCGRFRYRLGRRWGKGDTLLFVMFNPSTAGVEHDDATIRRCVGFALRHGYGAIDVVNLFAYCATDPKDLRAAGYPVGEFNDTQIQRAAGEAHEICVAWGSNAAGLARPREVLAMLKPLVGEPKCLAITRSGHPQHPSRLASSCTLQPYNTETINAATAARRKELA